MGKVRLNLDTGETQDLEKLLKDKLGRQGKALQNVLRAFAQVARSVHFHKSSSVQEHNDLAVDRLHEVSKEICEDLGHEKSAMSGSHCTRCGAAIHE